MKFSVIYSVDVQKDVHLRQFRPRARAWVQTEKGRTEYEHLEGRWVGGKHAKYCALLTRAQFEHFVETTGLEMEDVETLGSIGAPGFGVGWSPAFSFHSFDGDMIRDAYVTPVPDFDPKPETAGKYMADWWDRVKRAMLNLYGRDEHTRYNRFKDNAPAPTATRRYINALRDIRQRVKDVERQTAFLSKTGDGDVAMAIMGIDAIAEEALKRRVKK